MKQIKVTLILLVFAVFYTSSAAQSTNNMKGMPMGADDQHVVTKAVCVIYPTQGNNVTGIVTFTKVDGGVRVVADLEGLTSGKHGIHIHEYGDCSAADGTSAGGHFNPMAKTHGSPMESMRHEGDMGNIVADNSGKAHLEYVDKQISLTGLTSIIGRSVIVHKGEDDMKTQPTGNAGARVGYGVIGIGK